ncbi:MAG: PhnD/SsuA/transferrin family substrate-binding protein [Amphritea sp.]
MDKPTLLVTPSDTANSAERWYELAIYLSRQLDIPFKLDTAIDMADFRKRLPSSSLAYVPPQEVTRLTSTHNFMPLCRPDDCYEEVVLVSSIHATDKNLQGFNGTVIAGIAGSFPNRLGLTLLKKKGIHPASVANKESWLQVLKALQQQEQHYALLSKSFLSELNALSKSNIQVIASSKTQKAFSLFMLNPCLTDSYAALENALLTMHHHDAGKDVLSRHGLANWTSVADDELDKMTKLLGRKPQGKQ